MSSKTLILALVFLASGALLLVNVLSPQGLFPSGHGTGKLAEVITGACFSFAGIMLFVSRRKTAGSDGMANSGPGRNLNS